MFQTFGVQLRDMYCTSYDDPAGFILRTLTCGNPGFIIVHDAPFSNCLTLRLDQVQSKVMTLKEGGGAHFWVAISGSLQALTTQLTIAFTAGNHQTSNYQTTTIMVNVDICSIKCYKVDFIVTIVLS
jgi:hypothetical protein